MPHPVMFREGDPGLAEVRDIALGLPEAFEKVSHGRPVFCAPKMFAVYGGSTKSSGTQSSGTLVAVPHGVLVKVEDSERTALEHDRRFFRPAYLGPSGWLGLDFDAHPVDWDEVAELIDASFRLVAPRKLVHRLDQR